MSGQKTILVVDDAPDNLSLMNQLLKNDYHVKVAHSGKDALRILLGEQRPDLILLDIVMPDQDGYELCRKIKENPAIAGIPLIFLTVRSDEVDEERGLRLGAVDYITKPFSPPIVLARVATHLALKEAADDLRMKNEFLEAEVARRKAVETELLLVNQKLAIANRELATFDYSVSHDLKAPMRRISGFSKILCEDYARDISQEGQEYLQMIGREAEKMEKMIEGLLNLARFSRAEIRQEHVDLSELAEKIIAELRQAEPQRQVESQVQPGIIVRGDWLLLEIMLKNLLGNAWKFTAGKEAARIEVKATQEAGCVICEISDNGAGFAMNYADKLFMPFQRLHSETAFPGTGIGLATVARIVQRHGGKIWAESAVGQGATFFVSLPDAVQSGGILSGKAASASGEKRTILIVDDAPDNLLLLSQVLKEDYKIKAANNGVKALRIALDETPPDLILLDIMMPGMDGYEVCRRLKSDAAAKDIPVIFLTAKTESGDEALGLALGAVDYISKPITPLLVLTRVKMQLEAADYRRLKGKGVT